MTIRSSDQISIVDVTDASSVILTNENHTFPGTPTAAKPGSTTTQIMAMQGANQVSCTVTVSEITKPSGVTISSDGNKNSPTLTIAVDGTVAAGGQIQIPVHIGDITINKIFSFTIAYAGEHGTSVSVKTTSVTYLQGDSPTSAPSGTWSTSIPDIVPGKYLWTKTSVTYSDGKTTTAYSVSRNAVNGSAGKNGTSVTISSTEVLYQTAASGTTAPTGTWQKEIPSVTAGQYLWTRTVVKYSDGKSTTSYAVARFGKDGAAGAAGKDAITISIISSNGTIFKNTAIATTLTAHVFKGAVEVTGSALAALGTLKWYKDTNTTSVGSGPTLVIDVGDVKDKATYICQLES